MANSTGIEGNPYAGGNVVLNQTPFTNFYMNSLAREQAKNEAFAKTFQDQAKMVTSSGMRGQDANAFMTDKNAWMQDWIKNKDLIQYPNKDNGQAWANNNQLYNKAQATIAHSKSQVPVTNEIGKIAADPNRQGLLSDDARDAFHKSTLPIDDPDHVDLNMADLSGKMFNAKPLKTSEYTGLVKMVNSRFPGQVVSGSVVPGQTDPNTFKRTDTATIALSKDELPGYLQMGESLYNNGQLKGEINKIMKDHISGMNNPVYDNLNNIYKQNFGKNIDHPEEAATAWLMNENTNYGVKQQDPVTDFKAQKQYESIIQRKNADYSSGLALNRESTMDNMRRGRDKQDAIDANKNVLVDAGKAADNNPHPVINNGKRETWGRMNLTEDQMKNFTATRQVTKTGTDGPYTVTETAPYDALYKTPNGEIHGVFNQRVPATNADGTPNPDRGKILAGRSFAQDDKLNVGEVAKKLVQGTTSPKNRGQAAQSAVEEWNRHHASTAPTQNNSNGGYSNITQTNKGTIGIKNGKWYDIKTGKSLQ